MGRFQIIGEVKPPEFLLDVPAYEVFEISESHFETRGSMKSNMNSV